MTEVNETFKESTASHSGKIYLVEENYLDSVSMVSIPKEDPRERRLRLLKQAWMMFLGSLGMWSIGTVIVFPSVIAYDLTYHNTTIYGDAISLTDHQMDLLNSLKTIASLPGSWVIAVLMRLLGRRLCMTISGTLMVAGWVGIVFIPGVNGMLLARIISGVGVGGISVSVNTYCIEIPDPDIRGAMALIVNVGILAGQVLCMGLGYGFRYYTVGLVNLIIPIIFLFSILWLPESPSSLVLKGCMEEARKTLENLRGKGADINAEIQGYVALNRVNEGHDSLLRELTRLPVLKSIARVSFLFILMHFTGYYVVTANASRIFQQAGSSVNASLASLIITSVQLLTGLGASFLIDRLGRRKSLILSFSLMCVPLAVMAAYLGASHIDVSDNCTKLNDCPHNPYGWIPLVCLMVSQGAVVLGVNPIPFILSNEYFPTFIRPQASSICYTVTTIAGFLVLQFYTPMAQSMTQVGLFAFYSSVCALGIPYTYFFIKETVGKHVG